MQIVLMHSVISVECCMCLCHALSNVVAWSTVVDTLYTNVAFCISAKNYYEVSRLQYV